MNYTISDFINLDEKLKQLNIHRTKEFCILPENIEVAGTLDELVFTETTTPVKKYLTQNGVDVEMLGNNKSSYRQRKSIDFYAPLLFIGYSVFSENASLASIGLNVLSNYITDVFKGTFGEKKVKLEIVVQTTPESQYKSITYEGNISGIKELPNVIKSLSNE